MGFTVHMLNIESAQFAIFTLCNGSSRWSFYCEWSTQRGKNEFLIDAKPWFLFYLEICLNYTLRNLNFVNLLKTLVTKFPFSFLLLALRRGQAAIIRGVFFTGFSTMRSQCRTIPYFCVTLENDPSFSVEFLDNSRTACAHLPCRGR